MLSGTAAAISTQRVTGGGSFQGGGGSRQVPPGQGEVGIYTERREGGLPAEAHRGGGGGGQ